jgi:6-phosphogluconolactonase
MIQVFDDFDRLSQAAAELFADRARRAVEARGRFCVALAGGSTPRRSYQLLARSPLREQVPWPQVHVFWGDERCVAGEDPRSNARMAREMLLDHVPLPPEQIHPMACAAEPLGAALGYQQLLWEFFFPGEPCFDLVLLGLGQDGHTASLFPGTGAVEEKMRWVAMVQRGDEDFARLTLTLPLINQAALVVFLVCGNEKAAILAEVLEKPARKGLLPAQRISPRHGQLLWLADRAAAHLCQR